MIPEEPGYCENRVTRDQGGHLEEVTETLMIRRKQNDEDLGGNNAKAQGQGH